MTRSTGSPPLSPPSAATLAGIAIDVGQEAAAFIREVFGTASALSDTKSSPTDVVTATDVAAERLIRQRLLERSPGSTIVGEELADENGSSEVGWVIDPIDGTVNFLYDLPVVSVSIAATIDGEVVAGAVVDVLRSEVFSAATGHGARRNDAAISPSAPERLGLALIGTGFSYDAERRAAQGQRASRVLYEARDIRCMGSAALNLCWVGCGRLDAFYQDDMAIYDFAAGALIAEEAGAVVEGTGEADGQMLLAAAPSIADALRVLLAN